MTQNAVEAVKQIAPGDSGLRLTLSEEPADGSARSVRMEVVPSPDEQDQVLTARGAQLFLEPDAAVALEDMVLDAAPAGDRIRFGVRRKAEDD